MTARLAPPRRLVRASVLSLVVLFLAEGVLGFVEAGERSEGNVPDRFGTQAPLAHDRLEYVVANVSWQHGRLVATEPPRPYFGIEVGPVEAFRLGAASTSAVFVRAVDRRLPQEPHVIGWMAEVPSGRFVGIRSDLSAPLVRTMFADLPIEQSGQANLTQTWALADDSPLAAQKVRALCGLGEPWQTDPVPLNRPVPLGACWLGNEFLWLDTLKAVGWDTVLDVPAMQFAFGESGAERVWYTTDHPYPVQAVFYEDGVLQWVRLERFERGTQPLDPLPGADPPPAVEWRPREVWGLSDEGVDHPFPLSAAFKRARDDPGSPRVREFLARHPDAYVHCAVGWIHEQHADGQPRTRTFVWEFVLYADGQELRAREGRTLDGDIPSALLPVLDRVPPGAGVATSTCQPPPLRPPPAELPTVSFLEARWRHATMTPASEEPISWGFRLDQWASSPRGSAVYVGNSNVQTSFAVDGLDPRLSVRVAASRLTTVDGKEWGTVTMDVEHRGRMFPAPPNASQVPPTIVPLEAKNVLWLAPTGPGLLAMVVAAIGVGAFYCLWPAIKVWAAALFSRLTRPRALEHPVRAALHQTISQEPGIHFQELRRRVGGGTGATRHHLRKLVALGLVVQRASRGFVCYFPAATDRHRMVAAPVLKSDGARRILEAARRLPEATGRDLALATGLDPATVTYHLRRMQDAGLVDVRRSGKERRVRVLEEPTNGPN